MVDISTHMLPEGYCTCTVKMSVTVQSRKRTHATEMALKTRRSTIGYERNPVLAGYIDDLDYILGSLDLDDDGVG